MSPAWVHRRWWIHLSVTWNLKPRVAEGLKNTCVLTESHHIPSLSLPSLAWFLMTRTLGSDESSDPSSSGTKRRGMRHRQNRTAACTNVVLVQLVCCFGNTCLQLTLLNNNTANGVLRDTWRSTQTSPRRSLLSGLWSLGTMSAFAWRHRNTKKPRVKMADRSQGLSTDLNYV